MARRIALRFLPYRWMLCGTALLVLLSVALNMATPLLLREVIDSALPRHDTRLLIVLCVAMIASGVLTTAIVVALSIMTSWIGQRVVHELRLEVYDRIQHMPLGFFASEPTSEIQARMASDISGINDIITYTATSTLAALIGLLAAGLVMLVISWPLALFCLALGGVLGLFNRRYNAVRRDLAEQGQEQMAELLRLVGDDLTLSGIILGRTFSRHAAQRSRFRATSEQVGSLGYRQRVAGSTARAMIGVTVACVPPLIYLLAGTAIHGLSIGTAVVMVALQMRLTGPIQQLLGLNGRMQSSQAMFRRVFDYLDLQSAVVLDTGSRGRRPRPKSPATALEARGVWHRYPDAERTVLAGIDLDIVPGSTTVIMGHTGSGKTTLALILAGLVAPSGGTVRIGPARARRRSWPTAVGHDLWPDVTLVAQETALSNASIRDNLLFAWPDATDGQMLRLAGFMQLGDLIARLPAGLDTSVGEHGYQFSGGERQRLALVRALLAPGKILITDEATSALDNATAAVVHDGLRRLCRDRALVVIAHRIPRLAGDDQMIVLADGRIAHRGTHGELSRDCPEYRQLLAAQRAETAQAVGGADRTSS
jgi:ATP-binding cassette, subfamily B, bacterial